MNRNFVTKDTCKNSYGDWWEGQRCRQGWSYTHGHQLTIRRDTSAAEIPPERKGVPAQNKAPQPRVVILGREVSETSGCEKEWRWWLRETMGCWSPRHPSSRVSTQIYSLMDSEFQHWSNSSKGASDTQGGTGLSGLMAGAGGVAFFQTEALAKASVPPLNSLSSST